MVLQLIHGESYAVAAGGAIRFDLVQCRAVLRTVAVGMVGVLLRLFRRGAERSHQRGDDGEVARAHTVAKSLCLFLWVGT